MAYVEEVFENKGKWYGGHTGHEYKKSDTEELGGERWTKPGTVPCAPNFTVLETEAESPVKIKY